MVRLWKVSGFRQRVVRALARRGRCGHHLAGGPYRESPACSNKTRVSQPAWPGSGAGEVAKPGDERTSWMKNLDLGLTYSPIAFDQRLTLGLQVLNVFNQNETLQVDVTSGTDAPYTVSNTYLLPISR